jgi:hypothetical protein
MLRMGEMLETSGRIRIEFDGWNIVFVDKARRIFTTSSSSSVDA